jgi:hypothetical protein
MEEMSDAAGSYITHIGYFYNGGGGTLPGSANSQHVSIYMGVIEDSEFANTTAWAPIGTPTSPLLDLVYDGLFTFPAAEGFVMIELDLPYFYSGTRNLVVGVVDAAWEPNILGASHFYRQTLTPGQNRSIYYRSDVQANMPNIWNPQTATGLATRIPNTRFIYETPITGASLYISPDDAIAWGNVILGFPIPTYQFRIRNNGTEPVVINSISIGGAHATSFHINGVPAQNRTLAPGEVLPIMHISHTPSTSGPHSATLTIIDNRGGSTTTSISLTSSVSSIVLTVADLPYTQNFDGVTAPALPYGWSSYIPTGNLGTVTTNSNRRRSVPNSLRIFNSLNQNGAVMALSRPVEGLHQMRMSIYASAQEIGSGFQVGYITGDDATTFVPVQSFTGIPTGAANWTEYSVSFANVPQTGIHRVAITGDHVNTIRTTFFDDFTLSLIPAGTIFSCLTTNINLGSIYSNSVGSATITVLNEGSVDFSITNISLPGANWTSSRTMPIVVSPGVGEDITFTFNPTALGLLTGDIVLTTTASNAPTYTIPTSVNVLQIPAGDAVWFGIEGTGEIVNGLPFSMWHNNSYSQSIYTAAEMNLPDGGFITTLKYDFNMTLATSSPVVSIYMANVSIDRFATTAGWHTFAANTTPLYTGNMVTNTAPNAPNGTHWITFDFETPFYYDGTSNLLIAFVFFMNPFGVQQNGCHSHATDGINRSIYVRNMTAIPNINIASPPTGTLQARRPNTLIYYIPRTIGPALSLSTNEVNFGVINLLEPQAARNVVVSNTGTVPVVIQQPTLTGHSADFTISYVPSTISFPYTLNNLQNFRIVVNHRATAEGERVAILTFNDNIPETSPPTRITRNITLTSNAVDNTITAPHLQNFDVGVTPPALPAGWRSLTTGGSVQTNSFNSPYSTPNHLELHNTNTLSHRQFAITPYVHNITEQRVRFIARTTSIEAPATTLEVGTMTNPLNISTWQSIQTISLSNVNQQFIVPLANATGDRIAFRHGSNASLRYIMIDNVEIENLPTGADFNCNITNINFGAVAVGSTHTRAIFFQNLGSEDLEMSINLPQYLSITGSTGIVPVTIPAGTNRTINITLNVPIIADISSSIVITTNAANAPTHIIQVVAVSVFIVQWGTGNTTAEGLPWNPNSVVSYTQSIYTQSELVGIEYGSHIRSLAYFYNGFAAQSRQITIWMGWTTNTSFETGSSWVPINQLTQVYMGPHSGNLVSEWRPIVLDGIGFSFTPPSPAHNLVIATNVHVDSGVRQIASFLATATIGNRSIRVQSDGGVFNPSTPPTGVQRAFLPNIQFGYEDPGLPRPYNLTGIGGFNNIRLNWSIVSTPADADFEFLNFTVYRNGVELASGVLLNEYLDTEVNNGITYSYYIVANYDVGASNPSNQISVAPTGAQLDPPARLTLTGSGPSGTLSWLPGETILYESFEGSSLTNSWLNIDSDGDGYAWEIVSWGGKEGFGHIMSRSYSESLEPLQPENWLISPEFFVPMNGTFLNYWVGPSSPSNRFEKYQVMIANPASTNIADFVPLSSEITLEEPGWVRKSHSLNVVQDESTPVRIAFVHLENLAQVRSSLKLDGVSIVTPTYDISEYPYELLGYTIYRNENVINAIVMSTSQGVTHLSGWNHYWVSARYSVEDSIEISIPSNIVSVFVISETDDVVARNQTKLGGNYPNPFNPETTIQFTIFGEQGFADPQQVTIDIYNIKGQHISRLVDGVYQSGEHSVVWNGTDSNGVSVGSGIYFYRMTTDNFSATRKMVLMK